MYGRLDEVVPAPVREQVHVAEVALSKVVSADLPAPVRMACSQRVVAVVGTVCGKLSEFAAPGADNFLSAERCCGGASTVLADSLGAHLIERYGSAARDCDLSEVCDGTLTLQWRANDLALAEVAAWLAGSVAKADAALDAGACQRSLGTPRRRPVVVPAGGR